MTTELFHLVPMVGDNASDVLRGFDRQGDRVFKDQATCQGSLKAAVRPFSGNPSPYEAVTAPEATCLAASAAARETQRLGLAEVSQAFTEPSVRHRQAIEEHLAEQLRPEVAPAPQGPRLASGMRMGA